MPRNGSGSYNLPTNSWNPAINGVSATPADWQALINDVAAAIQASVSADGQTPMSGNLAMGGYRLTGAGAPSGAGMSLRWEQLIRGADIVSAATIAIPLEGQLFAITGSAAITAINATIAGRLVYLKFDAGIVLTHSSSLLMPSGVNVTTGADDIAVFVSVSAGVWRCVSYPRFESANYQSGAATHAVDGGTVNNIVASLSPAITELTDAMVVRVQTANGNTGPATLNLNGTGALPIIGLGGSALQGGELPATRRAVFMYSATQGYWILLGCENAPLQVAASSQSQHAVAQSQVLGVAQAYSSVKASRSTGVNYVNNTGKPIIVAVQAVTTAADGYVAISVAGIFAGLSARSSVGSGCAANAIVPAGASYSVSIVSANVSEWMELR